MPKENLFIAENQDLDVDEQKKNDILSFIESCNNFQDFIKKLEEENLIWYFIGPLHKDKDIKEQINLKWENEFQKFEQSITATHKKFEESLPGENFLVYTTKDNDFQIRFENKEKPIEISALLRASDEGKVYNLSLGKESQITATKKGSERHYDFTGSSSCEMTINWQAKDSKGNSVDCSMTVEVNSKGIKKVIDAPKFGDLIFKDLESEETKKKILELVEQNTEVFINGKTLHQTFTDMGKSVNEQQTLAEEIFTKDPPQSPIPSSSGYSSPDSRRSSFSGVSEFSDEEDEMLENSMSDDEKEYEQEGSENRVDEIIDGIEELKEEKETLAQYFAKQAKQLEDLKSERNSLKKEVNEQQEAMRERDQKIKEQDASIKKLTEKLKKSEELNQNIEKEGDTGIRTLSEEKQILEGKVKRLEAELKKIMQEKDQDIKQLERKVSTLEQSQKDKNARITDLINQLKDKESEIQSTNKELQKKLDQGETELSKLKEENTELINITKRILETDNNEKLLAEKLKEKIDNLVKELNEVNIKNKDLEGELERKNEDLERKIQQLEPGKSLADELSEVTTKVATSTQTEVEYKSVGIQSSDQETTVPKTQDQGTQAADKSSSKRISELRKENKNLARDKLMISEQLKQKTKEIGELKKNSKQLQEENTQLRQKVTKGTGVDASSSTDQKEANTVEVQTEEQVIDLYNKEGKYVRTELSDPSAVSAKATEKSTP
ncbi:coiled-coil domain-containing protein [Wolbachia endosymbiont (group B) of Athalia cordata]|uniref:hypothetical protein n=1 Tax=Wolbachia endosymbiont (group B) of Athalia cordata TaxID=2953986 RepID=UPI00222FF07C|nr:hypothetical protein [Wolbachia endosymbiont (group B) of Athalia cordata]